MKPVEMRNLLLKEKASRGLNSQGPVRIVMSLADQMEVESGAFTIQVDGFMMPGVFHDSVSTVAGIPVCVDLQMNYGECYAKYE